MSGAEARVWLGGELVETGEAFERLHRVIRYGDGLFATMRIRAGQLLDADRHAGRLLAGAAAIGLPAPEDLAERESVVGRLVAGAECLGIRDGNGVLRCQWFSTGAARGYGRGRSSIDLIEWSPVPGPRSPDVRVLDSGAVPAAAIPQVKSCSALAHVLAAEHARRLGCHDVLRVHDGLLTEGVASNLFFERGGALFTPDAGLPLYPGVIRERVLEEARRLGIRAVEGRFRPEELETCTGAFLTGSVRGLEAVARLDGRPLEPTPLFEALQASVESARESEGVPVSGTPA